MQTALTDDERASDHEASAQAQEVWQVTMLLEQVSQKTYAQAPALAG
jgi:hypothetical protein